MDLGFVEECEPWLLTNVHFPSKVGGKPAWLELKNIPKKEKLQCPTCGDPRKFLCQVYAPVEEKSSCFHRSILIFICGNINCNIPNSSKNILALRSQLPRYNEFYSSEPPAEDEKLDAIKPPVKLCSVCGCHGPLSCSRCKTVTYCGSKHQKTHWKYHKIYCNTDENLNKKNDFENIDIFPEFELLIEPESTVVNKKINNETEEEAENRRLKEYENLVKEGKVGALKEVSDIEFEEYSQTLPEIDDKQFRNFKKVIQSNQDQVIRYNRNGKPLWITDTEGLQTDVPNCEHCGGKRTFEFQIMPQLLNYLKDENLDWGVLAIFTCNESCEVQSSYVTEYVIKQDIIAKSGK